jgi:hypothetical protein
MLQTPYIISEALMSPQTHFLPSLSPECLFPPSLDLPVIPALRRLRQEDGKI